MGVSPFVIEDEDSCFGRSVRSRTIRPMTAQPPDAHAVLVVERDRLIAGLAERIVAPDPMTYGSQAAAASQVFDQQRDLALREKDEQHLEAVEAALARLDAGTFGTCVRCGRQIAPERLEALPWAAHCIDCQRIVGRGG
jgi:RNA polymerase-binding protein DksA